MFQRVLVKLRVRFRADGDNGQDDDRRDSTGSVQGSAIRSWRCDQTYIRVKGRWTYLYRGVDKVRRTVDFYLSERRDVNAAKHFFRKAMTSVGTPRVITLDGIDKLTAEAGAEAGFRNEPHSSGGELKSSRSNRRVPDAEALPAYGTVATGCEPMTPKSEMGAHRSVNREEALRLLG